jgi:hypothetical protein
VSTNLCEQYHTLREKRLALQREADLLEQQEKDILYEITKSWNLANEGYSGYEGGYAYKGVRKLVALPINWEAILQHVRQSGDVDLLQKRLTESAVKARWDAGFTVPGVDKSFKWNVIIVKGV